MTVSHNTASIVVSDLSSDDDSGYESDDSDPGMPGMLESDDPLLCPRCSRMFANTRGLHAHAAVCRHSPSGTSGMPTSQCSVTAPMPECATTSQYTDLSARNLSGLLAKDGVTDSILHAFKQTADVLHQTRIRQMASAFQDALQRTGTLDAEDILEQFKTLWPDMATTAQQRLVIESVLDTVHPVKRSLGIFRHKVRVSKKKFKRVELEHHVIEFPLAEMLEAVLQHECICNGIDAFRQEFLDNKSETGVISSFYDGEVYRKHRPIPKQFPDALAMISYGDGVTFTDPCSAYKAHKLQMNYWALLELPPALQGLSELVFVSSVCWTSTVKVAGPKTVFGGELKGPLDHLAFGAQLRALGHGQLMKTAFKQGGTQIVRAYLHIHAADTPEANVAAGKMETCTNTKHFCRLCFAQQHQRLMPEGTVGFVSAQFGKGTSGYCLRNPTDDAKQHAAVQAGGKGQPYGISNSLKGNTMFQDSVARSDFDPSRDIPTDGMHIGPEGVLATEFRRFLWWVSHTTGLTRASIDELIHTFPYHASEKSDPMPPLQANVFEGKTFNSAKKLKCTAAQASILARNIVQIFLPTMEDHGLLDTPQWMSLVSLCSAWRLLVEPVYTIALLCEVERLTYEHNR